MATNYTPEQLTAYFGAVVTKLGKNWRQAHPNETRDPKAIASALWAVLKEPNTCGECGYDHAADELCLGGLGTNTDVAFGAE